MLSASVIVLASLVVGGGALFASDALRLDGAPGPALAEHVTTSSTRAPQPGAPCGAALTAADPLALWIGGDSLAGSLGPSLGEQAGATGVVQPVYDSRVSSGLSTPSFFDWPEHATEQLGQIDPDVVVFIIGANDWKAPSSSAWEDAYEQRVEQMLTILEGDRDTRHVYWVGSPTMQEKRKDDGAKQVNAVARRVVDSHARASYVDAYQLFAGPDGRYTPTLPGADGKGVRVRAGDGIHLTDAGGDLLGNRVYTLIDERCRVEEHAIEGAPKPIVRAKGSDGPGGGSSGSGRTPATTSAPTTSAPTTSVTTIATTPATEAPPDTAVSPPAPDPPDPAPNIVPEASSP